MEAPPNLDEVEEQIQAEILDREGTTVGVIEELLNQHLAGFMEIGTFTISEDNRLEQVWILLTNRAFNSLRWAFHLLKTGYYSQSMMLTRSAFEDWLACEDSKSHPETIEALLKGAGRVPSPSTMAERLEEPLKGEWLGLPGVDGTYGLLSTFSHPRHQGLAALFAKGSMTMRLGPTWDENLFIVSADYLLLALMRMMEFIARLAPSASTWQESAKPHMESARICGDALTARAKARLEG